MEDSVPLYDQFSREYDTMVSWPGRLEREWPFLEAQFRAVNARSVLDVGTGTGMHAIWFARHGLKTVGTDPSEEMLRRARLNAGNTDGVSFRRARLGNHASLIGGGYDAVTCLGNTLPHVLSQAGLAAALTDFRALLRPGGVLVTQLLNYDRILSSHQRFLGVSSGQEGSDELLFFRFYDFPDPSGQREMLTFNVVIFRRSEDGWGYRVEATELYPIRSEQLHHFLSEAGFTSVELFGSYSGEPFDPASSSDLIAVAR